MSQREPTISPLPWRVVWHTVENPEAGFTGGDFSILDANGHALFFEGLGCTHHDPAFVCEAVNNYGWMKEKLELLGIRGPDNS